ncbi:MAG: hypothetical protein ACFFDS_10255 [Candidatus Thorarchaeota archaeon]
MAIIWGDTKEVQRAAKESFRTNLVKILKEKGRIRIVDLFNLIKHDNNLITDYQRIVLGIEELKVAGKIFIDNENFIQLAKVTVFDEGELKEENVCDIEHKEEDIKEKKEIIRKYSEINPYA